MQHDSLNLAKVAVHGTLWAYISTYGGKLLAFVATTILARLLLKEDFGIAGYALIFIGFLEMINGLGIGSALIFFPVDLKRNTSAFWLVLAIGLLLFIATWFLAPFIGIFFNDMRAVPVTRVLALTLPLSALGNVHEAMLRKNLAFKTKAIPDFIRTVGKGIVSIVLALLGFGVWSLIIGQLAGALFSVIVFWVVVPWRPTFSIAREFVRPLLSYGTNIVLVNVLGILVLNADYLLVGRYLGAAALGVYTLAFRVPDLLIGQFADIMGQVLFPVYSKMTEDSGLIKRGLAATLRYVSMVTTPLGLGLALIANPFVLTFFTDKWSEVTPILTLIAIASVINSFGYNFGDVYKAQGKPEVLTKISFLRAVVLLPSLWWAVTGPATLWAVSWVVVFVSIIGTLMQFIAANLVIGISFRDIFDAFRPAAIGGAVMALMVSVVLFLLAGASPLIQLLAAVLAGGITYLGVLWLFQREEAISAFHVLQKSLLKR